MHAARGAVSLERLTRDASGNLLYRFTRAWSDGTTGIKLSPLELLEKLAALVPPPRAHLVHYSGCLAPNSKLRTQVIPAPRQQRPASCVISSWRLCRRRLPLPAFAKRSSRSTRLTQASACRGSARCGSVWQRFFLVILPPAWLSPSVVVDPLAAGTSQAATLSPS